MDPDNLTSQERQIYDTGVKRGMEIKIGSEESIHWMSVEIRYLQDQRDKLQSKVNELQRKVWNLEDKLKGQEVEKLRYAKDYLRDHCNHDWGPVEWTHACGGFRTCRICGETESYYERD